MSVSTQLAVIVWGKKYLTYHVGLLKCLCWMFLPSSECYKFYGNTKTCSLAEFASHGMSFVVTLDICLFFYQETNGQSNFHGACRWT